MKFLENDKRNDIVNTVTQAMDEVSAENSESNVKAIMSVKKVFEELNVVLENRLESSLILPFVHSEHFLKYQKETRSN